MTEEQARIIDGYAREWAASRPDEGISFMRGAEVRDGMAGQFRGLLFRDAHGRFFLSVGVSLGAWDGPAEELGAYVLERLDDLWSWFRLYNRGGPSAAPR